MTKNYAIIIGGTSGIGKATAKELLEQGTDVLVTGRDKDKIAQIQEEFANEKGTLTIKELDLAVQSEVDTFIEEIHSDDRHITKLVNSAGVFKPVAFLEHSRDDFTRYHVINESMFFITQAVAKNMKAHNGGSIVNVGSMWAKQAVKATPSSAYSMAKAGLHSLTQHLAMELADFGIRVNAVSPAVVVTPIYGEFIEKDKIEETLQEFNSFHPIGRVGTPSDVAKTVVFLLGESSSWTTGSIIDVDGGVMAGRN